MKNIILTRLAALTAGSLLVASPALALPFEIANENNNAGAVTDSITSGAPNVGFLTLGINEWGGGYISQINITGKGDLMGATSQKYGRGGQSSIRDYRHSFKYNPTQAGFTDTAGTKCNVVTSTDGSLLTLVKRPACLFNGDGGYDFIRWENLADDRYAGDGGNSDVDSIPDSQETATDIPGKQATEITSEFDFVGSYKDYRLVQGANFYAGSDVIQIPCIRHYFEYVYERAPGHAIQQHVNGSTYDTTVTCSDLSNVSPAGTHQLGQFEMGVLRAAWALRVDTANWTPTRRWYADSNGNLASEARTGAKPWTTYLNTALRNRVDGVPDIDAPPATNRKPLIILSDSADENAGPAIGVYYPSTLINKNAIVGWNRSTDNNAYSDDRRILINVNESPNRIPTMSLFGFEMHYTGLLNPNRTINADIREKLRAEIYIFYGTPRQIYNNAQRICLLSEN